LLLLNLCLQIGGECILFAYYGLRHAVPKFEGLVRELHIEWRYDFGYGLEWVEVDYQVLVLPMCQLIYCALGQEVSRTGTLLKALLPRV